MATNRTMDKATLTRVVGYLLIVLFIVAAYFLLLGPRLSDVNALRDQQQQLEDANERTVQTVAELKDKKASADTMQGEADLVTALFPPDADQEQLFTQLRAAAKAAGISDADVTSIVPEAPVFGVQGRDGTTPAQAGQAGGSIASMKLTVTVAAAPDELVKFLQALQNMDRAYLISQVSESSGEVTIVGQMFMLPEPVNPNVTPKTVPTDIPAIGSSLNEPSAPEKSTVTKDGKNVRDGLVNQ